MRFALINIFDRQILRGMFLGMLVGIIATTAVQILGLPLPISGGIFWGAVFGGFAAYWPRFAKLGAVITRKPAERRRNMVVGILSLFLFALFLMAVVTAGGWLLTRCFPYLE